MYDISEGMSRARENQYLVAVSTSIVSAHGIVGQAAVA
jgi:hypothetical protein